MGIAMSYFLCPTLDFSDKCKEESSIFEIWATGQRHRGSPGEGHPAFFLGGHCQEVFFKPPFGFLP